VAPAIDLAAASSSAIPTCTLRLLTVLLVFSVAALLSNFNSKSIYLPYMGIGLGLGLSLSSGALLLGGPELRRYFSVAALGPSPPSDFVLVSSVGLAFAVLMTLVVPKSVKDRASAGDFNYVVEIELPFARKDVFLELLSTEEPLGVGAKASTALIDTEFRDVSTLELRSHTEEASTTVKKVIKQGGKRNVTLNGGTITSQLLRAQVPRSTEKACVIVWKQTQTTKSGVNMLGRGDGDEPGYKIDLMEQSKDGSAATGLKLEYYYFRLEDRSAGMFQVVPQVPPPVDPNDLQSFMIQQMTNRGYEAGPKATPSTAADATIVSARGKKLKDPSAEAEEARLKAPAAAPTPDLPPPAPLPASSTGSKSML